jgi:hypothetical protein
MWLTGLKLMNFNVNQSTECFNHDFDKVGLDSRGNP